MQALTYPGDCRDYVPNRIVGPDNWGAWYIPVSAHYFNGQTRIFYKPVPPDQLPPQAALLSKQVVAQQQQRSGQWPQHTSGPLTQTRSQDSLQPSPISRRSGNHQTKSGAKGLTKSQRELLKRFRKQG